MKAKKRIKLAISILLLMFLLINIDVAYSSSVQIHPPWGEDGNELYIKAFGKDRYLIIKTRTSAAINAAIDDLGAEGGEIYCPEGTYSITTQITLDYAATTITGAGASTIFQMGADVIGIYIEDKDRILLRNFTFDGNESGIVHTNPLIETQGTAQTRVYLENIIFTDYDNDAVFSSINTYGCVLTIVNCTFKDSENVNSRAIYTESDDLVLIQGCIFTDVEKGIVSARDTSNVQIEDCWFYSCDNTAIEIDQPSASIVGCAFNSNVGLDIDINASYNTISGNNSYWNQASYTIDISANNNTVTGNTFYGDRGTACIYITSTNNNISGNIIDDAGVVPINRAVYVIGGNNNTISGNTWKTDIYGVYLENGDENLIFGNVSQLIGGDTDIYVDSDSNANVIYGNKTPAGISINDQLGIFKVYAFSKITGINHEIKTTDYTIVFDDLGKSISMNSANDKTFTLPSVGADEDGVTIELNKIGSGKLTIDAADSDYVHTSGAGDGIFNIAGSSYASVFLEYHHTDTRWYIKHGMGTWVPYD